MRALRVLSPCDQDFSAMRGEGPTRFCEQCQKDVHQVETAAEVDALMARSVAAGAARVCVRFRHDGTGRALLRAAVVAAAVGVAACSAGDPAHAVQLGPLSPPPVGVTVDTDAGPELYMMGDIPAEVEANPKARCRLGPDGRPLPVPQ